MVIRVTSYLYAMEHKSKLFEDKMVRFVLQVGWV